MGPWKLALGLFGLQWVCTIGFYLVGTIDFLSLPLAWTFALGLGMGATIWGKSAAQGDAVAVRALAPHFAALLLWFFSTQQTGMVQSSGTKTLLWMTFVVPFALTTVWGLTWAGLKLGILWRNFDD